MNSKLYLGIVFPFVFFLTSCTSAAWVQEDFTAVKKEYVIDSSGKSNKDIADAIEIWVGQNFGSGKEVLQVKNAEHGIVVFRYREPYYLPGGTRCGVMVTGTVKPIDKEKASVVFSNIERTPECGWVSKEAVNEITSNFSEIAKKIERSIAEF